MRNFLVITSDRSRLIVQLVDRRFEPIPKIVRRLDIAVRRPDAVMFDAIDRGIDGVLRGPIAPEEAAVGVAHIVEECRIHLERDEHEQADSRREKDDEAP